MYEIGGLTPPEKIVWFDSPMAMCAEYKKIRAQSVKYVVVVGAVRNDVYDTVWDFVRATTGAVIWNAVRSTVQDAVQDVAQNAVWGVIRGDVGNAVWNAVWNAVYGSHEACWLAQYDYYREVFGLVEETDKLVGLFELAKSCGWIIPCEKVCYASERHNTLNLDSKGKLHSENGPAISHPDGWSIYADHGVTVPDKVVMDPEGFTLQELKKLKTDEVKIVLRKIGMEKFMLIPGTTSDTWTDLFNEIAEEIIND
jgi:hypothetical protein